MSHRKQVVRWFFMAILFAGLLPLLTGSSAVAAKIRVACVGDSITYGYGVPQRRVHGWPGVLQRLLGNSDQGVHPNAAGRHRIAQIIFQFLGASKGGNAGAATVLPGPQRFFLKNGDRVVFYGDSITEQRLYTTDVELYVRTRFPNLHVRFVNSGVGGDSVSGWWAGPVNLRLKRDVFAFKPNVVTIMLGMNDGGYQSFNPVLFENYKNGYEEIIRSLQRHLPGVRIVLIAPSPFDDVTFPPQFPGGYNAVLIRYGRFVKRLAAKYHLSYVNFNKPLVKVLQKAKKVNLQLAQQIIPQRVHPDADGQLVMAETLLKAWNAPAIVTAVDINAGNKSVSQVVNTAVSALSVAKGAVSWTQSDRDLPMPIMDLHENWPQFPPILTPVEAPYAAFSPSLWEPPAPNWNYINPVTAMVVKFCGFYHNLDSESLRVAGLAAPRYTLRINGQWVGEFSKMQLAVGINLARYHTPMMTQAYSVLDQVWREAQTRFYIWRYLQLPLEKNKYKLGSRAWPFVGLPMENSKRQVEMAHSLITALYKNMFKIVAARAYAMAEPAACQYVLRPASAGVVYKDTFKSAPLAPLNGRAPTFEIGRHIHFQRLPGLHGVMRK